MFRLTLVNLIPMKRLFKIKGLNRNFLIMIRKFSHRTVSVFESKIRVAFFYYYYCLHNFSGIMFAIKVIFKYIYIFFKILFYYFKKRRELFDSSCVHASSCQKDSAGLPDGMTFSKRHR